LLRLHWSQWFQFVEVPQRRAVQIESCSIRMARDPITSAVTPRRGAVLMQVELEGATGHVAFDAHGHRRDFQLNVNELTLNTDSRLVITSGQSSFT